MVLRYGALHSVSKPMITSLRLLSFTFLLMANLLDRIVAVIAKFQSDEADLRQQLADALAKDAADAQTIADAQAAAQAASDRAKAAEDLVSQLKANAEASADEVAAIDKYVSSLEAPAAPVEAAPETATPAPASGDAATPTA